MPWQIAQHHKGSFSFWIMSAESKSPFWINACQHKGVVLNNSAEMKKKVYVTYYNFLTYITEYHKGSYKHLEFLILW